MKRIKEKIKELEKLHSGIGKQAKDIWNGLILDVYDFELELDDSIREWGKECQG